MRAKLYLAWSVLKCLVAVALSPLLLFLVLTWRRAFIAIFSALWVHLDIYTPDGRLYLRRWFMTPKWKSPRLPHPRFLHLILLSDDGRVPHDHPGAFTTTILWNGYDEEIYFPHGRCGEPYCEGDHSVGRPGSPFLREVRFPNTYVNSETHTHLVKLIGPTLSWVVGWKKGKKWGFWKLAENPADDLWVESEEYGEKGEERKSWTIDGR